MKHWMFRCNDVSQKVSQSLDASLPFHHRMAVRMHLLMCRYCARFRRQLIMLRTVSRQVDDEPSTDETTRNALQRNQSTHQEGPSRRSLKGHDHDLLKVNPRKAIRNLNFQVESTHINGYFSMLKRFSGSRMPLTGTGGSGVISTHRSRPCFTASLIRMSVSKSLFRS